MATDTDLLTGLLDGIGKPMTALEITDKYTPDLPEDERQANAAYIDTVWNQVKPGGMWGWPDLGLFFERVEHGKWLLKGKIQQ